MAVYKQLLFVIMYIYMLLFTFLRCFRHI